jgi:hypothetical protein
MGDSEQDSKSAVPDWQRSKPQEAADSKPSSRPTPVDSPVTIERAKRFLQDEEVRKYSRERKAEFLNTKGFGDDVVQRLLEDEQDEAASQVRYSHYLLRGLFCSLSYRNQSRLNLKHCQHQRSRQRSRNPSPSKLSRKHSRRPHNRHGRQSTNPGPSIPEKTDHR